MKYFIPIPFLFIVIIFFQSIDLPLHNLPGDEFDRKDYWMTDAPIVQLNDFMQDRKK